ncbi:hypothetical protein AGRI_02995 [Alishewanella agri BL06]|jgi:hypothetical protein|uniref:Uncharacterized protein n=1 Tax=Alishewanella agri BL06 TaxID=1195246 RepID=I8UDN7_9ALTE|nr:MULTISPECIES: hypothetical protein [Gammaproteobacteria]ABM24854.1 hypothetical protein Sputw3181_2022 [Shewanella sp. W3-18-1]EIW90113.1 hypothetical protein AGRI_02995 [Alishewanella agri BL06]
MDWMDAGKVGLSSAAFGISCLALWISHRNWLRSNCPIVVACIETATAQDEAFIAYNLVVVNTGNRPAVNVRLYCEDSDLEQCIQPGPHAGKKPGSTWTHVKKCFQEDAEIPVLLNGKSVSNSFGFTGVNQQSFWKYNSRLKITLRYADLDGTNYRKELILLIKDSVAFAGGMWSMPEETKK